MALDGIVTQLDAFCMAAGVDRSGIRVRIVFEDGAAVVTEGLRVFSPFGGGDWVMVTGSDPVPVEATVFREMLIARAEFSVGPSRRSPIGFQAEQISKP